MKKILALILALALVLTAVSFAAAEDEKAITFQMAGEPQCLDPTLNDYSTSNYVINNTFRGLYKYDVDGVLVPALADSYTVSEDGLTYTFTLKDGLKWSDGSALTASDFEYSWKRVLNPEINSEAAYCMYNIFQNAYDYYTGKCTADDVAVKAVDDKTLTCTLAYPMDYFINLTATSTFLPVSKAAVEKYENAQEWSTTVDDFVCNGPFMMAEHKIDEGMTLVKNPNYYNADEVKLDKITIVYINSAETTKLAFDNGELDVAISVSTDAVNAYQGTDNLKLQSRIGYRYFEFNTSAAPFDNANVRRALNIALNREALVDGVLAGNGYGKLYGWVPYGIKDVLDKSADWRDVVGNAFEENVEEAKQLLADAGYPNGEGFPTIKLIYAASSTETATLAEAMSAMWSQYLGISTELVAVESYWADSSPRVTGDYNIGYMGYTVDYNEPSAAFNIIESDGSGKTRWVNDEFEALKAQMRTNLSAEDREAVYKQAESILATECPIIPIYNYVAKALVSSRVTGFMVNSNGHPIFEYCDIAQ